MRQRRFGLHSLRTRIVLLALFACLLLVAAGTSFFFFLNSSQRAKLDAAQRNLVYLAAAMKSEYAAQLPRGSSLQQVVLPSPPQPPPPPPKPESNTTGEDGHPPPPPPLTAHQHELVPPRPGVQKNPEDPLASITTSVLHRESDVEGGFYSAKADALVGYAFPTHEGPGGRREIPGKERPEIEELVREAVRTGASQAQSFHGGYDAILFVATPVQDGKQITGAAWLMQRMPGLEAGRSKQLLLGTIGFAAAAIICALLTFFITSEVSTGVQTVLSRLGTMEGSLGEHPKDQKPQLQEFEQVLRRVDALSDSLKTQIETQRALEDEVRHRQRLSALGQFAAGVAHELRNPLATIRLRTQMSQRASDLASVERNSVVTLDEVGRLDNMIERLLYFSRPIHLRLERQFVNTLFRQSLEIWMPRCGAEGVVLESHVTEELSALYDASKLRQVVDNLMENALQSVLANPIDARRIELNGRSENGKVLIAVQDDGAGLGPEAQSHALEPFFTTKDTGTGLGLSISYEIVQAHGGSLSLRNIPSGGAIAIISLNEASAENGGLEKS